MSSIRLPFFWLFFSWKKKLLCPLDCVFYHRSFYIVLVMFGQVARGQKKTKFGQKLQKVHQYSVCIFFLFVFFVEKKNTLSARLRVLDTKISPTLRLHSLFFVVFFFAEKKSSVRSIVCYLTVLNCSVPVFTIIKY